MPDLCYGCFLRQHEKEWDDHINHYRKERAILSQEHSKFSKKISCPDNQVTREEMDEFYAAHDMKVAALTQKNNEEWDRLIADQHKRGEEHKAMIRGR
jgi:hypothetical protein